MTRMISAAIFCAWANLTTIGLGQTASAPADETGGETLVLNSDTPLRAFMVFQTPVVVTASGELRTALDPTAKEPGPLPEAQSPLPPSDWIQLDFDDSDWDRRSAPVERLPNGSCGNDRARHSATGNSLICVRAKVAVDDPPEVADLKLSVEYVGGAIVYLNGREIARGHVPAGPVKPDTPAERYPDDLYHQPDGSFLRDVEKNPEGFQRRYRKLETVLPRDLLRKGGNVLALEIHRAPINEGALKAKRKPVGGMRTVRGLWAYAALRGVQLLAGSAEGVTPNISRPKGVQVWNVAPFEMIDAFSYGDPGEQLKPVTVHAARNSVFSGRLAVSSDRAIEGLKVTVSDLQQSGGRGVLPASAVRARYAEPAVAGKSWVPPHRFDGLLDAVPARVPVIEVPPPRGARDTLQSGAVASLWFTVRTPAGAEPGQYEGTITIEAEGLAPTQTPLRLNVSPWTMPDPADFRQHHLICPSPDSLARHYGVPLWSDEHFELMGKSLSLLAEVNSRRVPINLTIDFYGQGSNAETMVRWIRQRDGSFTYDFSLFDKYLDLVAEHCGKPLPLRLNCWGEPDRGRRPADAVSLLDPATGEIEPMFQPPLGTEESYRFWKPVIDRALEKLETRGWLDVAAFGHNSYCYSPKPEIVDVAHRLWPDGRWAYSAHNGSLGGFFKGTEESTAMPVPWSLVVWGEGRLSHRGCAALLEPRPGVWCTLARTRHFARSPLIVYRHLPEEAIERGHDGVGEFGAENFPIEDPQREGRFMNLGAGRGTGGGNNASTRALLAPGPDGPVATERFELYREGVELCEAVLYLERALKEKRIDGELAQRVNDYLDQRSREFIAWWWRGKSGLGFVNDWSIPNQFNSDARLLELAGKVAAARPAGVK